MKQTSTNRYWAFLALLMGLLFLPNAAQAQAQTVEDGTETNPYLIENVQEFWDFHECMLPGNEFYFYDGTYHLTRPEDDAVAYQSIPVGCAHTYFKLETDVVVNTGNVSGCEGIKQDGWVEWLPMEMFTGIFDGNNHIVSGLYCVGRQTSVQEPLTQLGFFTQLNNEAVVRRLGVTNSYIRGYRAIGGIAGALTMGSIVEECFFEGTLDVISTQTNSPNFPLSNAGGIVGISQGSNEINNCYATGRIYATLNNVGGIVGSCSEGTKVTNCYSSMAISCDATFVGPIYGMREDVNAANMDNIANCYYDKQFYTLGVDANDNIRGLLTHQMTTLGWQDLGNRFVPGNQLYPYIQGFDPNRNPSVAMSIIPIYINYTTLAEYETADSIYSDFTMGGQTYGANWMATSWNNALSVEGYNAEVHKQGIVNLIVQLNSLQRTYIIYPQKEPLLGTEENPFLIENLDHLTTFRDGINSGANFLFRRIKINYDNLANIHWKQVNDIDLSSVANWTPVGYEEYPFKGYYDGGDKTILNLTINKSSSDYQGMFGYTQGGCIRNVILTNPRIKARNFVSALSGYSYRGDIQHCIVQGGDVYGTNHVSGICGRFYGGTGAYYIYKCRNVNTNVDGSSYVGGICGSVCEYGGINRCCNSGNVHGRSTQCGGVCGVYESGANTSYYNNPKIYVRECLNQGDVYASDEVGGIVGRASNAYVIRCINTGEISGDVNNSTNAPAGIVQYLATAYECINTGVINEPRNSAVATAGVVGWSGGCYRCFNAGYIYGNTVVSAGLCANGSANQSLNVALVINNGSQSCYALGSTSSNSFFDKQMCPNAYLTGTSYGRSTSQLIGVNSVAKESLGTEYWIYEDGMYPRLKWTDTVDWARDIAIAAATPILLPNTTDDIDHVKPGTKLFGCDSNVVWKQMPQEADVQGGCLFVDLERDINRNDGKPCVDNAIVPDLQTECIGPTTVGAYIKDQLVKTVTLRRYVEPTKDTLTIATALDLDTIQKGVNSFEAFYYRGHLLPPYADSINFRVINDITMTASNWTPIGGKDNIHRFGGNILGEGHTISNLKSNTTYAGLFGRVTGHFQDLNFANVSITGGNYKGALCAVMVAGSRVENCNVLSGTISGGDYYTGGLVGQMLSADTVLNCKNYATVTCTSSYGECGGIVGRGTSARVINCENYGKVGGYVCSGGIIGNGGTALRCVNSGEIASIPTAIGSSKNYSAGGICGNGSATLCYNTGEINANGFTAYVGGVCGNGTANQCFNVANINALPNSTDNTYVGGVSGNGNPSNSYNAGIIYGNNRKYVGGITGKGNPSYCYNSNTVRDGANLAGVTASGTPSHCFYDKQLCQAGGIANASNPQGVDVAGQAEGLLTNDMLADKLTTLTSKAEWFASDSVLRLYPQLRAFAGLAPSVSSVMSLSLSNGEVWNNVTQSFYMHGCGYGSWDVLKGSSLEIDTLSGRCRMNVTPNFGAVEIGAAFNDTIYRKVRLLVKIYKENPLVIKDLQQLKNFAAVINSSKGYYNVEQRTYHLDLASAGNNYVEITDGGLDLYFKLITDIDVPASDPNWTPIGNYKANNAWMFRGDFNGDHHTIKHLKVAAGDYQGLFGYVQGIAHKTGIYDLTLDSCSMVTDNSGSHKGIMVGYDNATDITNCSVQHSTGTGYAEIAMTVGLSENINVKKCHNIGNSLTINVDNDAATRHGDIVGNATYDTIAHCQSDQFVLTGGHRGGAIAGRMFCSMMDSCVVNELQIKHNSSKKSYEGALGGVCGVPVRSKVSHCNIDNSSIQGAGTYGFIGGLVGALYTSTSYTGGVNPIIEYCQCNNVTLISSVSQLGGIVGRVEGAGSGATVQYCSFNGGSINVDKAAIEYVGGIVGYSYGGTVKIKSCTHDVPVYGKNYVGGVLGGWLNDGSNVSLTIDSCENLTAVTATGNNAGGICGYAYSKTTIQNCYNDAPVQGGTYVGGIAGYYYSATINSSYNLGNIKGTGNYVGGVAGKGESCTLTNTFNAGSIQGVNYVGGIVGACENNNAKINLSFNEGMVTGTQYVGGLSGSYGTCTNSYNAGIVSGDSWVGGLIGEMGSTSSCYNIGWVEGNTITGAVTGHSQASSPTTVFNDMQMSKFPENSRFGSNKLTTEMLNRGLAGTLKDVEWVYAPGMYPRLKKFAYTDAAIASATPVFLSRNATDTIYAKDVSVGHYGLGGCDSVTWRAYDGEGFSFIGCDTLDVQHRNLVQIANVVNGRTYKVVQLSLGISEQNPLEIVSLEQFKKFRDLINTQKIFYYDDVNKAFFANEGENFVTIQPGGDNMYFGLTTEVDLSLDGSLWSPIGTSSSAPFKGHFLGNDYLIKNLKINTTANYQGLFGYATGTITNVRLINPSVVTSGNYCAALVGYRTGEASNNSVIGGSIKGGYYVGGLTGETNQASCISLFNTAQVMGKGYVGGIAGSYTTYYGNFNLCFNAGIITATDANSYVGGIAGSACTNTRDCYNVGAINGKMYVGGIFGRYSACTTQRCYNAGLINATPGSPAVAAIQVLNGGNTPVNCFYDKQLSNMENAGYTTNASSAATDKSGAAVGYSTANMIGTKLKAQLDTTYWYYEDGLYPQLKYFVNKEWSRDASLASVQPVYIPHELKCKELSAAFTTSTDEEVEWTHYGSGHALNVDSLTENKVGISICGPDTLKVSKNNAAKLVPLYVVRMANETVVDTTCDGFYYWPANGRYFTQSGHHDIVVTVAEGCDSVVSLDLTIPRPMEITMESQNYTCSDSHDAYAQAIVQYGFERGYDYYWMNADGDTIGTTDIINEEVCGENFKEGVYTLSVRDKVYPDCEKSTTVQITKPAPLVIAAGAYDAMCYNQNDGYLEYTVGGGTVPYEISWGADGSKDVSNSRTDTLTGLAVGKYAVKVEDANHCTAKTDTVELIEDTVTYKIAAVGVNKMYDGIAVNPHRYVLTIGGVSDTLVSGGYKVIGTNGDTLRATVSFESESVSDVISEDNTLVGYTITKDGEDRSCRYNVTTQNSRVVISKRDVVLTSGSAVKEYDEDPLTNRTVTITGSGFVSGQDTLSCNVTGWQKDVGSSENTFTYRLNPSTDSANYQITTVFGTLTVGPKGYLMIVANSASQVYNGQPLTDNGFTYVFPMDDGGQSMGANDTVVALSGGDYHSITGVYGSITNVGLDSNRLDSTLFYVYDKTEYQANPATAQPINNFKRKFVNGTLTVTKRSVTLSTVSDSKVYDGTPLARPEVTVSGDGFVAGEVESYTATQTITDTGHIVNSIVVTPALSFDTNNYDLEKNEGVLTVTARPLVIKGASNTIDYDGQEHVLSTYTAPNLISTHTISGISYEARGTELGVHAGVFTGTDGVVITDGVGNNVTDNYDISFEVGALTIGQNAFPIVIRSNSNSYMYDARPKTYQNYTVLYNNTALMRIDTLHHYVLPTGDTLQVIPTGKGLTGFTHVKESGPNTFGYTLTNASYYDSLKLDTGRVDITRRIVQLNSKNDWSVYTGTMHPIASLRVDGQIERSGYGFPDQTQENVVCSFPLMTQGQLQVGSCPNNFSYVFNEFTDSTDYTINKHLGTVTVAKAPLTLAANNASKIYGEDNPALTYKFTGFVNGESLGHGADFVGDARPLLTTTATKTSPAGQYPIQVTDTGILFANYVVETQNGTLTINPRPLKLQANSLDTTYDGSSHGYWETDTPYYTLQTVANGGLLENDSIIFVIITGSRTLSGTTTIELSAARIEHHENGSNDPDSVWEVTQSYQPQYLNGTLTIDPVDIKLKPKGFTHEFDGKTYNSDSTAVPHFYIVSGALVGNDSIVGMTIQGSRSIPGKTAFSIVSSSIKIVDTTEEHNYASPQNLRTAGYNITLDTATLYITDRIPPYEITMKGKDSTMVYNGQGRSYSGWEKDTFHVDGFVYKVVDVTSSISYKDTVGTYQTVISGTPRVLNANNEDVTTQFSVTTTPGTLTITPKPVTIAARGVNVNYDFFEHSSLDNLPPYRAEGLCLGHSVAKITITGSRIIPGDTALRVIKDSIEIEVDGTHERVTRNYLITTKDSVLHIGGRDRVDTFRVVSKSQTLTYDGTPHTLTGFDTLRFQVLALVGEEYVPVYFRVGGIEATTPSATTVGSNYVNAITGTPVVYDAQNNALPDSLFVVVADTGKLTIAKRAITITPRDTTVYMDNQWHSGLDMHEPRFTVTGMGLGTGDVAVVTLHKDSIKNRGTIDIRVKEVVILNAAGDTVTSNYGITTAKGKLTVQGYIDTLVVSSASAEFEVDGHSHTKYEYAVTFGGHSITPDANTNGRTFTLNGTDKLFITPTCGGITNVGQVTNTFTYTLTNNAQYLGFRDTVYGIVKVYDSLRVKVDAVAATCYGVSNGSAQVTISGGKPTNAQYQYYFASDEPQTTTGTVQFTNLQVGQHTIRVKDSLNYEKTVTFTVNQPAELTLSLSSDSLVVCNDGTIMAFSEGGSGTHTYTMNANESSSGLYNSLAAGSYSVTVKDTNDCSTTKQITLKDTNYVLPAAAGITRSGSITNSAPDSTVNESGALTKFPALMASGRKIAQPSLTMNATAVTSGVKGVNVQVTVTSPMYAPILEMQVSTEEDFAEAYSYKFVRVTEGAKLHKFDLPAGTYYVRARLYNCNASVESPVRTVVID